MPFSMSIPACVSTFLCEIGLAFVALHRWCPGSGWWPLPAPRTGEAPITSCTDGRRRPERACGSKPSSPAPRPERGAPPRRTAALAASIDAPAGLASCAPLVGVRGTSPEVSAGIAPLGGMLACPDPATTTGVLAAVVGVVSCSGCSHEVHLRHEELSVHMRKSVGGGLRATDFSHRSRDTPLTIFLQAGRSSGCAVARGRCVSA